MAVSLTQFLLLFGKYVVFLDRAKGAFKDPRITPFAHFKGDTGPSDIHNVLFAAWRAFFGFEIFLPELAITLGGTACAFH
jgi:hypothetical protein